MMRGRESSCRRVCACVRVRGERAVSRTVCTIWRYEGFSCRWRYFWNTLSAYLVRLDVVVRVGHHIEKRDGQGTMTREGQESLRQRPFFDLCVHDSGYTPYSQPVPSYVALAS